MKNGFILPLIAAFLAALYYVSSESFIRHFGDNPVIMATITNIGGGIFLLLLSKNKQKKIQKIQKKDFFRLSIGSIFAFGLAFLFFYK